MSTATIVLEDVDGEVACRVTWAGSFDPTSRAHQLARMMLARGDELCEKRPLPESAIARPALVVDADGKPVTA